MRPLAITLLLFACAPQPPADPPKPPAELPEACATAAQLPRPPRPPRTLPQLNAWSDRAALVANAAIRERDACARNYLRLREWIETTDAHR
jgi:hypothetical protein